MGSAWLQKANHRLLLHLSLSQIPPEAIRILPAKPVDPSEKPQLVVQGAAPLIVGTHPYDGDYGFSCPGCGTILVETVDPQHYMR
jgi:hypothetical protein